MNLRWTCSALVAVLLLLTGASCDAVADGEKSTGGRRRVGSPSPAVGPSQPIPWHAVSLSDKPEDRWTGIVQQYKNQTLKVLTEIKAHVPSTILPILEKLGDVAENFWPLDWREEMRGVADALGVPVADVLAMNLFYELNSGCTSIVAQRQGAAGAAEGETTIYHGRNLDYGVPGLEKIAVNINFTKAGADGEEQEMYVGTTYVAYIGLLTGMKKGRFALSIDERDTKNGTVWDNAMEMIFKGGHSIGFLFRQCLEEEPSFSSTLNRLTHTPLDSPAYLVLSGTQDGEGAVITRERNSVVDLWRLDNLTNHSDATSKRWFLVETNYDHWEAPPASDDRRDPANQRMQASGGPPSVDEHLLESVLTQFPNLNRETTYTALMSAKEGIYYSMTQNNDV